MSKSLIHTMVEQCLDIAALPNIGTRLKDGHRTELGLSTHQDPGQKSLAMGKYNSPVVKITSDCVRQLTNSTRFVMLPESQKHR